MQSQNTPHILTMICEAVVLLSAIAIHCEMNIAPEMFAVPMSYIVIKTLYSLVGQKTDGQRIEIFLNLIIFILFALNFVK